jgi:DNA invertase Pin-like site-specific DNA recombinase
MRDSGRDCTMTHGGKREGAGRPPKDIAAGRVYTLHAAGVSIKEIARRFEVSKTVINRLLKNVKL